MSRKASPKKLKPRTVRLIATPGPTISHGAWRKKLRFWVERSIPQEAVPTETPKPRKDSDASTRITTPTIAVKVKMMYGATLGRIWRHISRQGEHPIVRAASMYTV